MRKVAFTPLVASVLGVASMCAFSPRSPRGALALDLEPPIRIEAAGEPIDTDVGHAAPFVGDIDGDGVNDLLVGQFGEGLLWVYRNEGTNTSPKLAAGVKFKDGAEDGRVPTG